MAGSTQHPQFRLKDSVYALVDPTVELYFSVSGAKPRLKPLRLSTMAPATQACRRELCLAAAEKLQHGQPYELVRVDA